MSGVRNEGMQVRRAIEICMSRLSVCRPTARDLAHHLSVSIDRGDVDVDYDADALRACLKQVIDLADADISFSKAAMISRFQLIKEAARRATK
jgi:hypothetical protein